MSFEFLLLKAPLSTIPVAIFVAIAEVLETDPDKEGSPALLALALATTSFNLTILGILTLVKIVFEKGGEAFDDRIDYLILLLLTEPAPQAHKETKQF